MEQRRPALEVNLGNVASEMGVFRGSLLNLAGNEGEMTRNLLACPFQRSLPCWTKAESGGFASCSQLCVHWPHCQTWGLGAACKGSKGCTCNSLKNQVLLILLKADCNFSCSLCNPVCWLYDEQQMSLKGRKRNQQNIQSICHSNMVLSFPCKGFRAHQIFHDK